MTIVDHDTTTPQETLEAVRRLAPTIGARPPRSSRRAGSRPI